ncbi:armadillo-like helical domain containing protein 1 isoform X4 [Archocentrus centrarchus]|uniref:armadillo-like helical domain containing protein 1 isoform X4 n=1 Tax=Archocentrus centrarchus TaxID=63155 RepID=UPI0011EA21F1|nr:armadillo-like helical domain containing protein 1 isoform X4 [Archocentrus centrarchus]
MSTQEGQANIGKVLSFLREWDRGDMRVRNRIASSFVTQNTGKTFYELELEFAQVASLFLARLTTWMRLTYPFYSYGLGYMFGTFLGLQLKAIGIFLSASSHDQYLMEFLEDGGVLTLLDILSQSQSREDDKAEALRLLLTVSNAGRKYKEIVCESHGVKVIADCLALSNRDETKEVASVLLESLSQGNPKYQYQVYKCLIAVMTCSSPKSQQLVLHTLRIVQLKLKTAHHSIVEPLLSALRSLHLEVQDEAIKLILHLKCCDVKSALLTGLVALLRPGKEEMQQHQISKGDIIVWRLLAEEDQELSHELLSLGVVQHLLHAMGNREHADAQIQASLALEHFVMSSPAVEDHVERVMGVSLFAAFKNKAETVYTKMDETEAEMLSNQVNMPHVLNGNVLDG